MRTYKWIETVTHDWVLSAVDDNGKATRPAEKKALVYLQNDEWYWRPMGTVELTPSDNKAESLEDAKQKASKYAGVNVASTADEPSPPGPLIYPMKDE